MATCECQCSCSRPQNVDQATNSSAVLSTARAANLARKPSAEQGWTLGIYDDGEFEVVQ